MFGSAGIPELVVVLVMVVFWLVPLAAGIWALVTLQRLAAGQQQIKAQLEAIERRLNSRPEPG
jgi:hypothetical protein